MSGDELDLGARVTERYMEAADEGAGANYRIIGTPDQVNSAFERLERLENDIFRPCHRHARNFGDRGLGPEVARAVVHGNFGGCIGALLRPGLGIANRAVGDQVFERRRSIGILRRERLDARDCNRGKTGSQRVTR